MDSYFHQPNIDPTLIHLWGPFQIRWYSLLYVGAFVVGRAILTKLSKEDRFRFSADDAEQLTVWLLIGAVVGARIFYCFVYDPWAFTSDPFYLFKVYEGGLSFHGGLIGTIVAAAIFARQKSIPFWNLTDAMALATPLGLAMGRFGNFINGELYGRVSHVPWAMIFRNGGPEPRHPSQLYEGFLEGVVLFLVLWSLKNKLRRDGLLSVVFLFGYTLSRFIAEFFREPDAQLGYLALGLSMGQILSLLMLASSVALFFWFWHRPEPAVDEPRGRRGVKPKRKRRMPS